MCKNLIATSIYTLPLPSSMPHPADSLYGSYVISPQNGELWDACRSGDVITAVSLLNSGADIEALYWVCFKITAFILFCRPMHLHP